MAAKPLRRPQNLGKKINPTTQRLGDQINLVIQDLLWAMDSILSPLVLGKDINPVIQALGDCIDPVTQTS